MKNKEENIVHGVVFVMEYKQYMRRAEFEKALNSLKGIIHGIKADELIKESEIKELDNWCFLQRSYVLVFPFKELIPKIKHAVSDGVLSKDEIEDIIWACNLYTETNPFFDVVTADIQVLQGIIHGILSDNQININELKYLRDWLHSNIHLETVYPYDEVFTLLHNVLEDGRVDPQEEKMLKVLFSDFIDIKNSSNIRVDEIELLRKEMQISGICALGPNIDFEGKTFCFTGESSRANRSEIEVIVRNNGGIYNNNIIQTTNYLIVGDNGDPCWAFSCYGRKIEKAIGLRKKGKNIIIAHEIDFWDALN